MNPYSVGDRVSIYAMRRSGTSREGWDVLSQDGRVTGVRDGYILVWSPGEVEGVKVNANPDSAEWFPISAKSIRVVRTGSCQNKLKK